MATDPSKQEASTSSIEKQVPPIAATAASVSSPCDATLAQALYAVETLTQVFGFDADAANQAVNAVGIDATACYNYILDQGLGTDKGGAIYPIDTCPHLNDCHFQLQASKLASDLWQIPCMYQTSIKKVGQLKGAVDTLNEDGSCPAIGENWLCLECGLICCSRYVNGHGLQHWEETKQEGNGEEEEEDVGHCLALSLADLSVWCHVCNAYLKHDKLTPLLQRLETLKFPENSAKDT